MTPADTEKAMAALSARMIALESLLAAVIAAGRMGEEERTATLAAYDAAAQEVRDRYLGLRVPDGVLDLVEQSYHELRELLLPP